MLAGSGSVGRVNQVANLADVGWHENSVIGGRGPAEYVPRLRQRLDLTTIAGAAYAPNTRFRLDGNRWSTRSFSASDGREWPTSFVSHSASLGGESIPRRSRLHGSCQALKPCGNALWRPSARCVPCSRGLRCALRRRGCAEHRRKRCLNANAKPWLARSARGPRDADAAQHRRLSLPRSVGALAICAGSLARAQCVGSRVRRTRSSGFRLPSAKSCLCATRSPMSARWMATVFFARASRVLMCWGCCGVARLDHERELVEVADG